MVVRLSTGGKNTRGLKGNSNAKLAITPHRSSLVMVKKTQKGDNRKLGQTCKIVHQQFQINIQKANIDQRAQTCTQKYGETLRSYIQRWSIIKKFSKRCVR
jgi:hypothetical protein